MLGTSAAFRDWALANRPEFGLIYGTPIPHYAAPVGGPTTESSRQFGAVFARIYLGLLGTGRLRLADPATMSAALIAALQLAPFARHGEREVAGHLDWIMDGSSDFVQRQMNALGEEMILPA